MEASILDHGAASSAAPATNAQALQDAIDLVNSKSGGVVRVPDGVFRFDRTVYLKTGVRIVGTGFQGGPGCQLTFVGPDGAHAIQNHPTYNSRLGVYGIRLEDGRAAATSGNGIHIASTNGTIVEHVGVYGFPKTAIYLGNTVGTPDNYTLRHAWVSAGQYGVRVERAAQNVLLEDIKGDSSNALPFDSLIYLAGGNPTGYCCPTIRGAKVEVAQGSSKVFPNVLRIGKGYIGPVSVSGLHLGPNGGYVVVNDSANVNLVLSGAATPGPGSGLVFDSVSGRTWGGSTAQRIMGLFTLSTGCGFPTTAA